MRSTWEFIHAPSGSASEFWLWHWQVRLADGANTQRSPQGFSTLEACIGHAKLCGYEPGTGDLTALVDPRLDQWPGRGGGR
jgi:hypothetical protein